MPITTVERESPQSNEGREKHENTKTRSENTIKRGASRKTSISFSAVSALYVISFHTLFRPARSIDAEAALKPVRRLSTLQRLAMPALTRV